MSRVKRGVTSRRKHKKLLNLAKGYRGGRSKLVKQAKESVLHAGEYAFAGRKQRRRDLRRLWITQLGNILKTQELSYSKFIASLKVNNIKLDRKSLSDLAVHHPGDFQKILSEIKKA